MASLENTTTAIYIQESDPLYVETKILTENSPVFSYILGVCKFKEHDMSDFDSGAVRIFLTMLVDRKMRYVERPFFRDINKMAMIFEVKWMEKEFRNWITKKMFTVIDADEVNFLFEESYFILKRLEKKDYMKMFINQFGRSDDTELISKYFNDFENLESQIIHPLLQLGGSNSEIFYKTLSDSVSRNPHLTENALFLLQNIDLKLCFQVDWEQWSKLFDKIADLPEMPASNFKITQKLLNESWRAVIRADSKKEKNDSSTMTCIAISTKIASSIYNCTTPAKLLAAAVEGETDSTCIIVLLLTNIYSKSSPCNEEIDRFISDMERLCHCGETHLGRVSWQIIDPIISVLKHSTNKNAEKLIVLLTKIRKNILLSWPNREGIVIRRDCKIKVNSNEDKLIYIFKHPAIGQCKLSGKCGFIFQYRHPRDYKNSSSYTLKLMKDSEYYEGTGLHFHDVISAIDMCVYCVVTLTLSDGTELNTIELPIRGLWWGSWFPRNTKGEFKDSFVAYNVSDYMVAK